LNTLAKVFIVAVFALSLAVLAANASLFATRDNYKSKLKKAQGELQAIQQTLQDDQAAHTAAMTSANLKIETTRTKLQAEEGKREKADREILGLKRQMETLTSQKTYLAAINEKHSDNVKELTKQATIHEKKNKDLIGNLDKVRDERNRAVTAAAELENQIETLQGQVAQLQKANKDIKDELNKLISGVDRDRPREVVPLDGYVKSISDGFIVITVGKKDRVKEGEFFDVFRGAKLVGRIVVVELGSDFALCREKKEFQKMAVREGDRIANYYGEEIR